MSRIVGRGRYARETYPEAPRAGVAGALARGWAETTNDTAVTSATPVTLAAVNIIPRVTGKFRVIVTGRVNDTSGAANGWQLYIGHGPADPLPSDYSITASSLIQLNANAQASFSAVVDLDKIGIVFPLGTSVRIGVAGQTTAGNATVPAEALQIEVQEVI